MPFPARKSVRVALYFILETIRFKGHCTTEWTRNLRPLLNAYGHVSNFTINLWGKYLCFALLAISVDLLWGYTGLLSLGQSLFFALGGYMLGMHVVGYESTWTNIGFACLIALCVVAGYALLGAGWLIMKTDGDLQKRAVHWARRSLWLTALGVAAVSLMTPLVSAPIFEKWFSMPNLFLLSPIPLLTLVLFVLVERNLRTLPRENDRHCWIPFAGTVGIFVLAFLGLAYSLYPNLVVNKITIWDAASAPESLTIILVGTLVVLPVILAYTIFSYRVFWGKARELTYY